MNSLPTDEPPILDSTVSDSTVLDDPVVEPSGRSRFIGFIQVAAIAALVLSQTLSVDEMRGITGHSSLARAANC